MRFLEGLGIILLALGIAVLIIPQRWVRTQMFDKSKRDH